MSTMMQTRKTSETEHYLSKEDNQSGQDLLPFDPETCPPCPKCGFDIWWNGKCFYCDPPNLKGFTVDVICPICSDKIGEERGRITPAPIEVLCDACCHEMMSQAGAVPAIR